MTKRAVVMAVKRPRRSSTRKLHRTVGAGAAVFVIFMVLSGLVINHSNQLGLDRKHISQPLLMDWYGVERVGEITSYRLADRWLSFADARIYIDDVAVSSLSNPVGAVATESTLVAAGTNELLLLDFNGSLVERIAWSTSDAGSIASIGLTGNYRIVVNSAGRLWLADKQLLTWQPADDEVKDVQWASPNPTPVTLQQAISRHYAGGGLSLERVLLDLHSGRIFGSFGILIYDLLALATGFLALSGLALWFRSRRNGKAR